MNKNEAMGLISMLMADVDSIRVLVTEVGEGVEPNGSDYFINIVVSKKEE